MAKKSLDKWQFGDFQTPDTLAEKVVSTLIRNHAVDPDTVLEPSCGQGAFIRAVLNKFETSTIIGLDINAQYIETARESIRRSKKYPERSVEKFQTVTLDSADFFDTDWDTFLLEQTGYLLIIGNPPWVTSSELSILNSKNMPSKSNFQNRRGIESITGSGNFDISEWMLLQYIEWLSKREGMIAILCKYSVARKVMRQVRKRSDNRFRGCIYLIDAKLYFNASVEACLFVLFTDDQPDGNRDCKVYSHLDDLGDEYSIGERDGLLLKDTVVYERWKHLSGQDLRYLWRSGMKHDCARVMVFEPGTNKFLTNGFGKKYRLEEDYLFPLLKSSDIGNNRTQSYRKLVLVTQRTVGEDTSVIQQKAPKTWHYLVAHDEYMSKRRSSIYKNKPPYSIFGIGSYTFKPWKIAISALYKKLNFCVVGPLDGKAVIFDDTVNFLAFDSEQETLFIYELLTSQPALNFFNSMIFWDEKRPITIDLLRRLSLKLVAHEIGLLDQYLHWAEMTQVTQDGQLVLGLSEQPASYTV